MATPKPNRKTPNSNKKTPRSKKKRNKKAKEAFKDTGTIDLTSSLAPSSAADSSPSARPDAYSVPNSPAKSAVDKAAMPPPTSRPGEKSASQPQAPRDPNADWRRAGTGVHDDYLARSKRNFRHQSLRRGSGMSVETPQGIRKEKQRRIQQGRWSHNPSQASATSQAASTSNAKKPPKGPQGNNNPYGLTQRQSRRGDVPPLKELQGGYQRATAPARQTGAASNFEPVQRPAPLRNPEPVQKPATAPPAPDPSIPNPTATETPGSQTPRRNFSMACKIAVMKLCLESKDMYLNMTPSPSSDQKPFWDHAFQRIEASHVTQGKFKDWKDVRYHVDGWVQPRRTSLRGNNLPAPSVGQPDLDRLIDEWNRVFAQRFCAVNRGYFESNLWPLAEGHVMSIMQSEIQTWVTGALERRMNELDRHIRPVLGSNRRPEDYDNPVRRLFYRSQAAREADAAQVRETEALLSLVLDLQPGLRDAIADDIRNAESNDRTDNNQSSGGLQTNGQRQATGHYQHTQDEIMPSIETPTRTTGHTRAPGYHDQPVSSPPMTGRSYDRAPRKRKGRDRSRSTPSTNNLSIRTRELPGHGNSAGPSSKRRRVDGGMSEFPSPNQLMQRSSSAAQARDTPDDPFVTPQPPQRATVARRQESPNRFRERTEEFNNMTLDSKIGMLYRAVKESCQKGKKRKGKKRRGKKRRGKKQQGKKQQGQ